MKYLFGFLFCLFLAMQSFALSGLVDLNSATQTEIENLPGVGKKTAEAIIAARPFNTVNDLKNVKGIGDGKFEKLKSLVQVGSTTTPTMPKTAEATKAMETATTAATKSHPTKVAMSEVVNLNTATKEQIEKLPGIGPTKADAIIAARPFTQVEDVMKVKGIKEGIFSKIKPYITVR